MRFSIIMFLGLAIPSWAYDKIVPSTFQKLYPSIAREKIEMLTVLVNHERTTRKSKQVLNAWIDENWPETSTADTTTEQPMETKVIAKKSMFPDIPGAHLAMDILPKESPKLESKSSEQFLYETRSTDTPFVPAGVLRKLIGEEVVTRSYAERIQNAPQFNPDKFGEQMQPNDWEEVYWLRLRNATRNTRSTDIEETSKKNCIPSKEFAKSQGSAFLDHRDALKHLIRFIYQVVQKYDNLSKEEAVKMRKLFWKVDLESENMDTESMFLKQIATQTWSRSSHEIYFGMRGYVYQFRLNQPNAQKLDWNLWSGRGC